jgi:hypothetical protein
MVDFDRPLQPPQPLKPDHQLEDFDSGNPELNDWLHKRALNNEDSGASRTYVVTVGQKVVAYYSIAVLNDFLCIGVLMDFGEIKFMFLGEKLKQKFDDLKRLT